MMELLLLRTLPLLVEHRWADVRSPALLSRVRRV